MAMPPRRRLARACLAAGLLALAAGCAQAAAPPLAAPAADFDNLLAAATALGPAAAACAAAPPPTWSAEGLALLAAQAPQWAQALEAMPRPSPAAASRATTAAAGAAADDAAAASRATTATAGAAADDAAAAARATAAATDAAADDAAAAAATSGAAAATAATTATADDAAAATSPAAARATAAATGAAAGDGGGGCRLDQVERDLARVEALAWRVAEAAGENAAVPIGIGRAAQLAQGIGLGTLAGAGEPEAADLANLPLDQLAQLALAEDQAGFLGEQLAALAADQALGAELAAAAERHRRLAEQLVAMAGGQDPRAPAYQLGQPPADAAAARSRWAAIEMAVASHYAALPLSQGVEARVIWQLAQAHAWGAELPALPFVDLG
ncbi:MAG: hypothetical protein LBD51_05045 [Bifidobacteriaceae bacterium]|jgi:hypothetical protein|nr:hypothetical protein [Bifidobacteriaceae bacterium]